MTKFVKSLLVVMFGLVLVPGAVVAAPEKPSKTTVISAYVGPSVVYIGLTWTARVYDGFNKSYLAERDGSAKVFTFTGQCSGYIVNPNGYIATAGHCLDPKEMLLDFKLAAAEWAVETNYYNDVNFTVDNVLEFQGFRVDSAIEDRRNPDRETIAVSWGTEKDQQFKARLISYQKFDKGDAGLIKVEATGLQAIKLADSKDLEIGTEVVSIGYPALVDDVTDDNYTPSYKDGQISSKKTRDNGLYTFYEVSAALAGGMSGGPTVNLDGDVIGFNSFGSGDSEQFNFVGPSERILERIADAGIKNEIGDLSRSYNAGLDAYFAGDKDVAISSLQAVVDDHPRHEMALKYLRLSKKLPDPFPIGLVAGIAAGLLVIIGGGAAFLVRRMKGGKGGPTAGGTSMPTPSDAPAANAVYTPSAASAPPAAPAADPVPDPVGFLRTAKETAPPEVKEPIGQPQASAIHFCTSCGTKAETGALFCLHCGKPV